MHADAVLPHRVSPFGNLRIEAYVQLPEAYRSLSRPSSAPDAKAFPLRSFQLDLFEIFGSHIVELCRQFTEVLYRNCYPHLYDVPQLKQITFCCLAYHFSLCSVFKVQRSGFETRLKYSIS